MWPVCTRRVGALGDSVHVLSPKPGSFSSTPAELPPANVAAGEGRPLAFRLAQHARHAPTQHVEARRSKPSAIDTVNTRQLRQPVMGWQCTIARPVVLCPREAHPRFRLALRHPARVGLHDLQGPCIDYRQSPHRHNRHICRHQHLRLREPRADRSGRGGLTSRTSIPRRRCSA